MPHIRPARASFARERAPLSAVLLIAAVLIALVGLASLSSLSTGSAIDALVRPEGGAPGVADGDVPAGVTVFDDEYPAVANLDRALLAALRRAAPDAARVGVELHVNSGWRSRRYQEHLLRGAVQKHGSKEEAARWVATADTSPHVSGEAVDIGGADARTWLAEHGATYGLCQIYDNEPWHFELRPEALTDGCPARYADPTHDPRLQP